MYFFFGGEILILTIIQIKCQTDLPPSDLTALPGHKQILVQGEGNEYGNGVDPSSQYLTDVDQSNFNTLIDMDRSLVPGTLSKFYFYAGTVSTGTSVVRLQVWRLTTGGPSMQLVWDKRVTITSAETKTYEANVFGDNFKVTSSDRLGYAIESGPPSLFYTLNTPHSTFWTKINLTYFAPPLISAPTASQIRSSQLGVSVLIEPDLLISGNSRQSSGTGNAGSPGQPGATGPSGFKGATGLPGPVGYKGAIGIKGYTGATGFPGQNGIPGIAGRPGSQGPFGDTGMSGYTGNVGSTGSTGQAGFMGATGLTGYPGRKGDIGDVGPPGNSSNSIPGLKGIAGNPGVKGSIGSQGLQGITNRSFTHGDTGFTGFTGPQGATGPPGPQGPPGTITSSGGPYKLKTCYSPRESERTRYGNYPVCAGKPTAPTIVHYTDGNTLILKCQTSILTSKDSMTFIWTIDNIPLQTDSRGVKTVTGTFDSRRYSIDGDTLSILSPNENDNGRWINCFISIAGFWSPSDPSENYVINQAPDMRCNPRSCGGVLGKCEQKIMTNQFVCNCYEGYKNNGTQECIDIDECAQKVHNCSSNSVCRNIRGSFRCDCMGDFEGVFCNETIPSNRSIIVTSFSADTSIIAGGVIFCATGTGIGRPKYANLVSNIESIPRFKAELSDDRNNGKVCFVAPEMQRIFVAVQFDVILVYNNNMSVPTNQTITFTNNPEIVRIMEDNPASNSEITFLGSGFNGVDKIALIIDFTTFTKEGNNISIDTLNDTNMVCRKLDGKQFKCPLPNLSIESANGTEIILLNDTYQLEKAVNSFTPLKKIFIYKDFNIQFNERRYEINVNKFFNPTTPLQLSSKFTIDQWKFPMKYDFYSHQMIKITGSDLTNTLYAEDYNVTVGGVICPVRNLYSNLIECRPIVSMALGKAVRTSTSCQADYSLMVRVRSKNYFVGCVVTDYSRNEQSNLVLLVGLTVALCLFAFFVLIAVVACACVTMTTAGSSKKEKSRRGSVSRTNILFEDGKSQDDIGPPESSREVGESEYINRAEL